MRYIWSRDYKYTEIRWFNSSRGNYISFVISSQNR